MMIIKFGALGVLFKFQTFPKRALKPPVCMTISGSIKAISQTITIAGR